MDYTSPDFKKWLDKLQQESWQLELIISGFAIYGLLMAYEPLQIKLFKLSLADQELQSNALQLVLICCSILTFNLILHVLLRGLWIGAIGLRYVSGDIDFEKLNYSEKFNSYLKRKVGSFDRYIFKLENYCSVLFAISFLLIFYITGIFTAFSAFYLCFQLLASLTFVPENILEVLGSFIEILFLLASVFVMVDFFGQGILKKKRWTSKLYFPIYWVFSKITFSFLYRPLAYNFLDNKLGKRVVTLLIPTYILLTLVTTSYYKNSAYLSNLNKATPHYADTKNYENETLKDTEFINIASIPSKVIDKNYLKVFMTYREHIEDFVIEKNESLKSDDSERGYTSSFLDGVSVAVDKKEVIGEKTQNNLDLYLETVNQLYSIKIDSLPYTSNFVVSRNAKKRLGFETYLNIKNLSDGKHVLTITGPAKENKWDSDSKTIRKTLVTIPFWYFPE
ncbi:hypothetical protein [Zobellia uliginosa]|uniref:hypothetical protein n=1 Tax=Zobellia uliginosa TaxID=143224 RepID=UPI001C07BCCA|nr:hypothetical protein [Zobellia uliginosa]MBU2946868.1 hypothetical protein [Zobellia uliginosa]